MLRTNLFKNFGIGALILSATIMPLMPASAQVDPVDNPPEAVVRDGVYEDDGFDWGWLGLIGLFGLAGLAGKKRQNQPTAYRETDTADTGYRD